MIIAAALTMPHLLPRYVTAEAFIYKVEPATGHVCIAGHGSTPALNLAADALSQLCANVRERALAELDKLDDQDKHLGAQ